MNIGDVQDSCELRKGANHTAEHQNSTQTVKSIDPQENLNVWEDHEAHYNTSNKPINPEENRNERVPTVPTDHRKRNEKETRVV